MRTFDRIILATLALGVWALVLSPRGIEDKARAAGRAVRRAMNKLQGN
jgi:hypothetical protein